MRILLIEDDVDLAANTADYLEAMGHTVDCADRVRQVPGLLEQTQPELVILDLMLPDGDGISVAQSIRQSAAGNLPILMLTARDTESDKLRGFSAGADDYLIKPFSLPELAARVAARVAALERRAHGASVSRSLQVADLHLDLDAGTLRRGATPIHLKPAAFRLLAHLMANTHRVVPRAELESLLWGDSPPDSDLLRTHIHAIRKEVDTAGREPLVHTSRGVGYRVGEA
ncbi:response regulator transcription factor [uncultured Abyssibacter sp.]|uniref:response regulator transcription factor n=1 Tax=uncultured Abyssibacter sp. TaxID=2320202 RepID=UPI0032B1B1D0